MTHGAPLAFVDHSVSDDRPSRLSAVCGNGRDRNTPIAVPARVRVAFDMIANAAERGDKCPSNALLAAGMGCGRDAAIDIVRLLETMNLIRVERGRTSRIVTIVATGKATAGPQTTKGAPSLLRPAQIEWTPDRDARLCDAIADGLSFTAASRLLGISSSQASGRFARIRQSMGWQAS